MPVRRIVTPRGRGVRGKFPSQKNGAMITWESTLERDACRLLEFSLGLRAYSEQPKRIKTVSQDKVHSHIPDFELITVDGAMGYIEVKPKSRLQKPEIQASLNRLREHLEQEGYFYFVLDEEQIRRNPRHKNLLLLCNYRSFRREPLTPDLAYQLPDGHITFCDLKLTFGVARALQLLADQFVVFDINQELTNEILVWQPEASSDETILL